MPQLRRTIDCDTSSDESSRVPETYIAHCDYSSDDDSIPELRNRIPRNYNSSSSSSSDSLPTLRKRDKRDYDSSSSSSSDDPGWDSDSDEECGKYAVRFHQAGATDASRTPSVASHTSRPEPSKDHYETHTAGLSPDSIKAYHRQHKRSRALVDRGANGGIAGPEMRHIAWAGRAVDLSGIDDHTLRSVQVGTFGALVRTHLGERILIWHQMAHMPDGRTILSAGQMEARGTTVNEKSPKTTGRTPHFISSSGYIVPMAIRAALPYIELRPYTDDEWRTVPHIEMTQSKTWDPTILDAPIPDDWYEKQEKFSSYIRDNIFTEDGDLKEAVVEDEHEGRQDDLVSSRVDRDAIKAYFHNVVRDECETHFWYNDVDGELFEHLPTKLERKEMDHRRARIREVNDARTRPRRSSGLNKYLVDPELLAVHTPPEGIAPSPAEHDSRPNKKKARRSTLTKNASKKTAERTLDETTHDWTEPDATKDYNNPAKAMDDEHPAVTGEPSYHGTASRLVKPSKVNYESYSRHFPGVGLEAIKRTFKATTQCGRVGAHPGFRMKQAHKSPNPALNTPRRNEPVATDTVYGPKGVPAVDDGSTAAQIFVGRKSNHVWIEGCGHSDKNFVKVLYDCIRKFGAMDVLISDRAKAEISEKVKDLLRMLFIDDWQSEPHNKNQAYHERVWQDIQAKANNLLNFSGAPDNCWLLALKYVAFILNHVALAKLGWRTPIEWLFGYTPDITCILQFIFYEPVYYRLVDTKVGETDEALGRFVGFAENVGHDMTFLILTNSGTVLRRSIVRTANKGGGFENFRALKRAENIRPGRNVISSPNTFKPKKGNSGPPTPGGENSQARTPNGNEERVGADDTPALLPRDRTPSEDEGASETDGEEELRNDGNPAVTVETVEAEDADDGEEEVGPDTNDVPEEPTIPIPGDDESHHSWIKRVMTPSNKDGIHRHTDDRDPIVIDVSSLLKRSFITEPDENGEQVRAVIQEIEATGEKTADKTQELFKFRAKAGDETYERIMTYNRMLEWCERDKDKTDFYTFTAILGHRRAKGRNKWELLIEWSSGETTWEPYSTIFEDDPVTVALYAEKHGLTNSWPGCKRYIKNRKTMARMVMQTRLKNFRNRPKYKFGVQIPRNHEEAMKLDAINGNSNWANAEQLEISQLNDYDSFQDLGKGAPVPDGYKKIRCHFVYDQKHDGRAKARFVAGGHMTDTPSDSIYSGVVSIPGIRMITFLAELNDLELWATDIGNAYLESVTQEKVVFVAGPEFGDKEGHLLLIHKAQYGLKSSGKRWHERLHDVLRSMGFFPSKAEEDIWMRDAGTHYECVAVYVDDLMIASHDPKSIIKALSGKPNNFKLKGTGPVTYHLGNDFFRDTDGTLCFGPKKYIEKMTVEYQRMFGEMPKRTRMSPLEKNDHPELDDTELLDDDGIRKYQSLIGTLQWTITLGRFDVATAVMTMSSFRAAPRVGHLERLKRICGYLYRMKNGFIRVRTEEPDYSSMPHHEYDWARSVYGEVKERVPSDAPPPRGKRVVMSTFKDANLYHDLSTGRAVTGVLHFLNQTPIDWFTKKQATVETATYGSEFSAARTAIQQITGLRLTLRYLGVPIHGATHMFGDNESVVKSGSLPHSPLHKRWHGLAYHYTREAIASGMISFHHIPGTINPADVLSKHWGYSDVWEQLQAILFWEGDPADLLVSREDRPRNGKGSDKVSRLAIGPTGDEPGESHA